MTDPGATQPQIVTLHDLTDLVSGTGEASADGLAARVGQQVEAAFASGAHRVEAEIPAVDRDAVEAGDPGALALTALRRALQRHGLRPEGRARGRGPLRDGVPTDTVRYARLANDPEPGTPAAFLGMLDASLPSKRLIVQGLIHDGRGSVALCELTYKKDWDLPGGVADPAESPVTSLERELREELGLELAVGDLLAVNWLPPYKQWADAVLLVFDVGVHPDLRERATLQVSELKGVHWRTPQEAGAHVAPYVHRWLISLAGHDRRDGVLFLEDGLPRT